MAMSMNTALAIAALQGEVFRLRQIVVDTRTHLHAIRSASVKETDRLCHVAGLGNWNSLIARLREFPIPDDAQRRTKEAD